MLDVSVKETSVCIVDDAGVASEPEALLQVLTNTLYRFKRVGFEAGPLSQWLLSALAEAGITDAVTVHDCIGFLAPQVPKGRDIILDQFTKLYAGRDPLAELRDAAGSAKPVPVKGSLDPAAMRRSIYAFS